MSIEDQLTLQYLQIHESIMLEYFINIMHNIGLMDTRDKYLRIFGSFCLRLRKNLAIALKKYVHFTFYSHL